MANEENAPAVAAQEPEEQPNMFRTMLPIMLVTCLLNLYMQYSSRSSGAAANVTASMPVAPPVVVAPPESAPGGPYVNAWSDGHPFSLRVFLSANANISADSESELLWAQDGLYFNWNPANERSEAKNLSLLPWMLSNQTLYAHIYFLDPSLASQSSSPWSLWSLLDQDDRIFYHRHNMTRFVRTPLLEGHNLLNSTGAPSDSSENVTVPARVPGETYLFWKPILNIDLVYSFAAMTPGRLPPGMTDSFMLTPSGTGYFPIVFINEINLIGDHYVAVNSSLDSLPLSLYYNTYHPLKYQVQQQLAFTWNMQVQWGMAESDEFDEVKRIFLETSPWLLAVTMVVSVLHSVFDFLAFKNEISFWRSAKSYDGLSVRSIVMNAASQFIILLYLMDNDTSWMILISNIIGLVIELWKIKKTVRVRVSSWNGIPILKIRDRVCVSKTKEYDEEATRYLSWVMNPLMILYSVYTLYFNKYKSWYSWIVSSLTSFVYMFGFIMMTPQLYINYRLKSVAHMPWRAMIYKSLNTFIDDLFSFVVKMPMMHRIACLRDDVIFFVYLYQKWAYPIDKKRRNEFGLTGEEEEQLARLRKEGKKKITMEELQRAIQESNFAEQKKRDGDSVGPAPAPSSASASSVVEKSSSSMRRRGQEAAPSPPSREAPAPEAPAHRPKLEKLILPE